MSAPQTLPLPSGSSPLPYSAPATPSSHPTQVGIIGLGNIGFPMARNLAVHMSKTPNNTGLIVYNRTRAKSEKLSDEVQEKSALLGGITSIRIADSVEEVAKLADIIITSLPSDQIVEETYEKLVAVLKDEANRTVVNGKITPKILVETSTIYPKLAGKLDSVVSAVPGTSFVCAPVFGAPAAANKAQLIVVLAGDYKSKKEVAYLLVPACGRKAIDMGGNVEKAASFKLIGNAFIAGTIELLAETYTIAEKSGIGANHFHSFIKEMFPAVPVVNYGTKMVTDAFDGTKGFALEGGLKDVSHIRQLSADLNSPLPVLDIAHQHLLTARALHAAQHPEEKKFEVLDWSAMVAATRIASGLDPFDTSKHSSGPILEDE